MRLKQFKYIFIYYSMDVSYNIIYIHTKAPIAQLVRASGC